MINANININHDSQIGGHATGQEKDAELHISSRPADAYSPPRVCIGTDAEVLGTEKSTRSENDAAQRRRAYVAYGSSRYECVNLERSHLCLRPQIHEKLLKMIKTVV
jgi:hypothetical protein